MNTLVSLLQIRKSPWCGLAVLAAASLIAPQAVLGGEGFVLKDHLNRTWRNELVRFPIAGVDLEKAKAGKALGGPDGKPVSYQLLPDQIAFAVDLGPFETRTYTFSESAAPAATDLKIEELPDVIRLTNDRTGITLRRKLEGTAGPISEVRLSSGLWVGGSRFDTKQNLTSYTAEITARGPVYAEVTCKAVFGEAHSWIGVFRLQAGEPVVLVDEKFDLGDSSRLAVSLGRGFAPTEILWRPGSQGKREVLGETAEAPVVFRLQPWSQWGPTRMGKWFGLFGGTGNDLLMLGARDGDVWVDLRRPHDASVLVEQKAEDVVAMFPLEDGQRRWMIGSFPKDTSLGGLDKPSTPLPQEQVIKHEFPLDRVKDYVLEWPNANEEHPRLYVTPKDVAKLKGTFQVDPVELARLTKTPVDTMEMGPWVQYYLVTGDPALGKHLADTAVTWMQNAVDMQVRQVTASWLGRAPHGQTEILTAFNLADAVLAGNAATPEQKQRLRSQAAFLGYTLARQDYWSPLRGFAANPNMTSHVAAYQTIGACLIFSHPKAREWVQEGLRELKDVELDTWPDENGGWIEAPGYAMVSWEYMLGSFIAARNSGFPDYVNDPNAKKLVGWFSKLSTPPDSRLGGARHIPPIGHTWKLAWCGEFGLVAAMWKEKDPELAANMAWMHKQNNSYNRKVGGFIAAMAGYRDWLADISGIEPKPPVYGSELFPESGVLLRSHFPSDRETMLHMIGGENGHHYDYDSGSITLWGKGRIVSDEFGYYGRAANEDHSMVEVPLLMNLAMRLKQFSTSPRFDYVRGSVAKGLPGDESRLTPLTHLDYQHSVYNDWIRQIAFVKDPDPLGPNYFVINDSLRSPMPATWRMWFVCTKVETNPHGATVIGKEDVDTDIFFARPDPVTLKTEEKTRATHGFNKDIKYGKWDWTQTGLIAPIEDGLGFTAVVYPRLKTEAPPKFTSLDGGRVVKIESAAGTDHVFLGAKPFEYHEGGITFRGTSGSIQQRGKKVILTLGAAGQISGLGQKLASDKPAFGEW